MNGRAFQRGGLIRWVMEKGRDPSFADPVDPASAALIVIDVQNDFLHPDGAFGKMGRDADW